MGDREEDRRRSVSFLRFLGKSITLDNFSVIGNYVRFDSDVRRSLQTFCDRVSFPLVQSQPGLKTFLVWGPSGSGKSGLIYELGKMLKEQRGVGFPGAVDLSRQSKEEYVRSLQSFSGLSQPKMGWIDEIDAKPEEKWPYDELFAHLPLEESTERVVFILSGSGMKGDTLETFVDRIANRQKGKDVLTRTCLERTVVPPLCIEDRILVASSVIAENMMEKYQSDGDEGCLIEKLALHYLALAPGLEVARALKDRVLKAVDRKSRVEPYSLNPTLRYDDLFSSGDDRLAFLSEIGTKSAEHLELLEVVKVVPSRKSPRGTSDREPSSTPSKKTNPKEPKDRAGTEEVRTNLKAAPFGRFIRREDAYTAILKGLRERTTPILVIGLVGTGKTSLAYEVANNCRTRVSGHPHFRAVVWVSDKSRPGSTTLNEVLDEVARTIDYPGLTQMETSQKRRAINDLLRTNSTLVVFDSFESIREQTIAEWLCEIPEPSKAIVTSQPHKRMTFPRDVKEITLKGMTEEETHHFIEYQIGRMDMGKLVKDQGVLAPLLRITEGNPKAIELGLGLIKRLGRPLDQVVADLSKARPPFDEFCSAGWNLLDENARNVLFTMYFFPYGTKSTPLREMVGLSNAEFDHVVELLSDLQWLDSTRESIAEEPSYSMHGLVSAYVSARLHENQEIESALRHKWLAYLRKVAAEVGFCWNDIGRLKVLDDESLRRTIRLGIDWSFEHGEYSDTIAIASDVRYYFYVRGYWSDWSSEINLLRAEAARRLGDDEEEFAALTYQINIASKQRNLNEIEGHLKRLDELADPKKRTPEDIIDYNHAKALYFLAKRRPVDAERIWIANLELVHPDKMPHAYNANLRWLASCLEKEERNEETSSLLRLAFDHAQRFGFARGIVDIGLKKARLCVKWAKFPEAAESLEAVAAQLEKVLDRSYEAEYFFLLGRVDESRLPHSKEAKEYYTKALDGFKRLGMKERVAEVESALASVITVAAPGESRLGSGD